MAVENCIIKSINLNYITKLSNIQSISLKGITNYMVGYHEKFRRKNRNDENKSYSNEVNSTFRMNNLQLFCLAQFS